MALGEELERAARAADAFAAEDETVALVLAAEPVPGDRVYLCAFDDGDERTWLALEEDGKPIRSRNRVREAVSIAALCEVAEETAGGGELADLRARLVTLRLTENPPGLDEAEAAALELERTLGAPPRVASPSYLDHVGAATARLERALGDGLDSPFAAAMRAASQTVVDLASAVELAYKVPLE